MDRSDEEGIALRNISSVLVLVVGSNPVTYRSKGPGCEFDECPCELVSIIKFHFLTMFVSSQVKHED